MAVLQGSLLSSVNNATFHSRCHCYLSFLNCNEVWSRFHPCFLQHDWKYTFQKRHKQKIYFKTHMVGCCIYLFCVCSEIGSEMTYFIQERVGSKVADNNTNMSNSCHFITVAKKSTSLCYPTLFNY